MIRALLIIAVCGALALLPGYFLNSNSHSLQVLMLAFLFAAMAQSWNIVGGLANQVSLGHAAFFGVGAYTSTLLLIHFGISPWAGMLAGGILGGLLAFLISLPTMQLEGHYFALATLAFGEVLRTIANSWTSVTGGPVGLSVPFAPDSLAMLTFRQPKPYYFIAVGAAVTVTLIFESIRRSALGYRLRAVRENIAAAEIVGVDTARVKIYAAVISGALMAMCGTLFAQANYFFDPDTVFALGSISIRVALIAIIGGVGTAAGPVIGALFIIPLEEVSNAFLSSQSAGLSQLVYGLILIAVILIQPRGIMEAALRFRQAAAAR
ncbi:MAG: branched-chain amino acid ABC transporter permease [Rhodomicrobium sp.]